MKSAEIIEHLSADPRLRVLLETLPFPSRLPVQYPLFVDLLRSIVSQQLSVKAAATIYSRLCQLFPDAQPTPQQVAEMPIETLRSVGLSQQKAAYVGHVAAFFIEHTLSDYDWNTKSDSEIVQLLTQIKGVGTWTVEMLLLFSLNRPDVFPVGDLGIQQGMKRLYSLEQEGKALHQEMEKIAASWRPFRSYACFYLWNWKDMK